MLAWLSIGNSDISGFTGPYGQADLGVIVQPMPLAALSAVPPDQYYMVDGGSAGFNVNAATFSVTGVTGNSNSGTYAPGGLGMKMALAAQSVHRSGFPVPMIVRP